MALSDAKRDEIILAQDAVRETFDKMIEDRITLTVRALRTIDVSISRLSEEPSEEAVDAALDTITAVLS